MSLIKYDKTKEQMLVLTMESPTRFSIKLHGVARAGHERHLGDHALRDCVRLLTGKPWEEFECEYDFVGTRRNVMKGHLKLVTTIEAAPRGEGVGE